MVSHGHSFKTDFQKYTPTCGGDHTDERGHCTDGNSSVLHGITKESVYGALLGQLGEKKVPLSVRAVVMEALFS